ncbi:MAG: glycosyltransferase family 2 protein [Thermoguttaceae bacterium]|nr:glycosyltransferase family 2 protein [Thermoguttaceae bacterium]
MKYVTIGIPFYNAEKTFADAIRAVFAQTHPYWELILMDDGSTDRSLEIARSIDDPRVRVISDGKNLGLAARLNHITREARYDYLARMDADDLMAPDRIEKEMRLLEERPDIDLVSTGMFAYDSKFNFYSARSLNVPEITKRRVGLGKSRICHAAVLGRKAWFLRHPYDEDFSGAEDSELWCRAALDDDLKIALINEPLYAACEESSCTSFKKLKRSIFCAYRIYGQYRGKLIGSRAEHYKLLFVNYLSWGAKLMMHLLRIQKLRMKIRNSGKKSIVSDELRQQFETMVTAVRAVHVPGLPDNAADQ